MSNNDQSLYVNPGIKQYRKSFVGYLDVLGFKEAILESDNPDTLLFQLDRLIRDVETSCGSRKFEDLDSLPVKFTWMSDSILLYTEDCSLESFKYISNITAGFIMATIEAGPFLVRGALSLGDFYFDRKSHFYLGPAMLDAIEWEKDQNWSGVILTPDAVRFVTANHYDSEIRKITVDRGGSDGCLEISGPLLVEYDAPLKRGFPTQKPLCINWTVAAIDNISFSKLGEDLISLGATLNGKSVKEKIENTVEFMKHCKQLESRIYEGGSYV